ncbi:hypothetical protein [Flavihumibacter profundi]|uniref:hypothetical protein n=1 Tax=Flavihumibacter profundi TaxID=2716883 RepID=UPI001CC5F1E0|nr:hypothetical protein [Flavihumibacter profundi]MBZ5857736.1 hypothetical protein [Flavihumibacter profundi]
MRDKIYYVPGLISLLILPLLFIYFSRMEIRERTIYTLPLYLSTRDLPLKYQALFDDYNGVFPPNRNYVNVGMEGNDKLVIANLNYSKFRIREILAKNDTINGLRFRFGKNSKYWSFVSCIDILKAENARTFVHLEDDIYFYYLSSDTTKTPFNIDLLLDDDIFNYKPRESWIMKTKNYFASIWTSSSEIIVIFIGFLFSIWVISRANNGR